MAEGQTKLKSELRTIVIFGLVGIINTGITAGIMWLSDIAGVPYPIYTSYAYVAGMLTSFVMNRIFTFRQGQAKGGLWSLVKFVIVSLGLLGLVQVEQFLLIERLGLLKFWGVAIGMVLYTGLGYILNRLWVFRSKPTPAEQRKESV